ncbi:MAG: DUF2130 domain-containing protein [Flavobacteriaceae bacterium]|jgi:hypothetical protein|nr:DUF2130 domain-containing protein [Flavobacteriaceae bacterium]
MNQQQTKIQCPNCGVEINVNDILKHQIEELTRREYQEKFTVLQNEIQAKNAQLEKEKQNFEARKKEENRLFQERLEKARKEQSAEIKMLVQKQVEEENKERIFLYEKELAEKSEKLQELNKLQAAISKLNREKDEMRAQIEAETQKKLNEEIAQEREKIRKQEDERNELKIKELQKQLEVQKHLTEEMKRKQEQGSTQLQGEVQELAIEETLKETFLFDEILEVPKGINGADVVHKVRNKFGKASGIILYESKRTKNFGSDWISKLKSDAIPAKADVCILVTEAMPENIKKIGLIDNVWVCSFTEFKWLAMVIRENLIKINEAYSSQTNKGEKMEMLYNYLTSNEFSLQMGAIIEGFAELQNGYIQERNAMEKIWKKREKQLEKVLLNTNHFVGAIQGIAGNSITIKQIGSDSDILALGE